MLEASEAAEKHKSLTDRQLIMACNIQDEIEGLLFWFTDNPPDPKCEDKDAIMFRILKQKQLHDAYDHLEQTCCIYRSLVKMTQNSR